MFFKKSDFLYVNKTNKHSRLHSTDFAFCVSVLAEIVQPYAITEAQLAHLVHYSTASDPFQGLIGQNTRYDTVRSP